VIPTNGVAPLYEEIPAGVSPIIHEEPWLLTRNFFRFSPIRVCMYVYMYVSDCDHPSGLAAARHPTS
jgi:hypothetical protein